MAPYVIIAYRDYPDIVVEQEVLSAIDAEVVQITDLTTSEGQHAAERAEALMVTTQAVSDELLASMPQCRIVSRTGTGIDAIDLDAATARGIWVSNVPDYAVDEVSTHVIALLLSHARGLPLLFASTRQGRWDYTVARPIRRLAGQKLGLIGFGRIAQAVAIKAMGLGLDVLAHDLYSGGGAMQKIGACSVDLDTLLREADIISLHTPLTAATHQIIDVRALACMKPTAFLINTARGALIDEDALLESVRAGRIVGAALDVLPKEPPTPDHPLLREERVWVTPHSAWYSEESAIDMRQRAAEEVVRVLSGKPPRAGVNKVTAVQR